MSLESLLVNLPDEAWTGLGGDGAKSNVHKLHRNVAFLYSVHAYRASAAMQYPREIVNAAGDVVDEKKLPVMIDIDNLLYRWSISVDLYGTAYGFKVQSGNGRAIEKVRYIDPETITPIFAQANMETGHQKGQLIAFRRVETNYPVTPDGDSLVIYCWLPGQRENAPGVSPTMASETGSQTLKYMDMAQRQFFESGAIDQHLIFGPQANVHNDEKDKFKAWWARLMRRGVRNQGDVQILNPDTRVEKLNSPVKDWVIPDLSEENKQEVADAHNTPLGLIEPERMSNRALIDRMTQNWINGPMKAHTQRLITCLNNQLLHLYDLEIKLKPEEMNINMEDERERSAAVVNLVRAGENLQNAYSILGYTLPDGYKEPEEPPEPDPQPIIVEPEPTNDEMKAAEIDALHQFIRNGTHKKRPFRSDVLTPDEIEFYSWKMLGDTPEEKDDGKREQFNQAMDAFKSALLVEETKEPQQITVNIQQPQAQHNINVDVPEQQPPVVNVETKQFEQPAPIVNVNVEPTPVQVDIENNVEFPRRAHEVTEVTRDQRGLIDKAETKTEYES